MQYFQHRHDSDIIVERFRELGIASVPGRPPGLSGVVPHIGRDLVYFLSAVAFSWGVEVGSRANHMLPMSILLRVGYHGLLRPGEIANLRVEDVSVSLSAYRPKRGSSHSVVQVPKLEWEASFCPD